MDRETNGRPLTLKDIDLCIQKLPCQGFIYDGMFVSRNVQAHSGICSFVDTIELSDNNVPRSWMGCSIYVSDVLEDDEVVMMKSDEMK